MTTRQHQVLQLLADGLPRKQIAARLGISAETVKAYQVAIYAELEVQNAAGAVATALRRRLIE